MAGDETLDILGEIQALVLDKLQVVSYKWLSRNFSVSSNDAKRLLQDFIEKHDNGLEVIYTLSGWLKCNPQAYHISLVPGIKLSDVKQEFKDICSVQVYSVQACMPKDPAVLWNTEFAQSEELFDQPSTIDNCLRDNRFCGISNSFVKHNVDGKPAFVAPPNVPKIGLGVHVSSRTNAVLQNASIQQHEQKFPAQSSRSATAVMKTVSSASEISAQSIKPHTSKETGSTIPSNKAKVPMDKAMMSTGGSLANMWGRASTKLKPPSPTIGPANDTAGAASTAEAHTSSRGALDSMNIDNEEQDINFKRESNGGSGRKRKVVIDFSDDEDDENIVSLVSPEPPNKQLISDSSYNDVHLVLEKKIADSEAIKPNELGTKQVKAENKSDLTVRRDIVGASIDKTANTSEVEKKVKKNNTATQASSLPKRKKVLKTQIDERGREVTEVVWEGEAAEANDTSKEPSNNGGENRPPMAVKGPATSGTAPSISNATGKAGNKKTAKGGPKDAKQGNILSFFKKI